ncbi:MAG: hypothetical protein AAF270_05345 [Pseudomonadota bacterium]
MASDSSTRFQPQANDSAQRGAALTHVELNTHEQCWGTLSRDGGGVSLTVRKNPAGEPWRLSKQALLESIATARELLAD